MYGSAAEHEGWRIRTNQKQMKPDLVGDMKGRSSKQLELEIRTNQTKVTKKF
jgi:hypothetical protein